MNTVQQQIDSTGWVPFRIVKTTGSPTITQHLVKPNGASLCGVQSMRTGNPVPPDEEANPNWNKCRRCGRLA